MRSDTLVFGIDASGQQRGAPTGELDVWITVPKLAAATGISETTIRNSLEKLRALGEKGQLPGPVPKPPGWEAWGAGRKAAWTKRAKENTWIRVRAPEQAEALVRQLKEWAPAGRS